MIIITKRELKRQLYFKNIPLAFTILAVGPIKEPPITDVTKNNNCKNQINRLYYFISCNYVCSFKSFSLMFDFSVSF